MTNLCKLANCGHTLSHFHHFLTQTGIRGRRYVVFLQRDATLVGDIAEKFVTSGGRARRLLVLHRDRRIFALFTLGLLVDHLELCKLLHVSLFDSFDALGEL